jgi:hypothetical protein
MTRGDRTNITMADLTFTAKQQTALLVLWPCLKAPPRIDVPIGPEGIRFGATFDKTAPGTICETVRSDYDQIAIATNLDVATVEVDFEKLKAAADLGSVDEAVEVWENIKAVVSAAASAAATTIANGSRNALEPEEILPWDLTISRPTLLEQLSTAAPDTQLFAYKAHLKNLDARHVEIAAANVALSEFWHSIQKTGYRRPRMM